MERIEIKVKLDGHGSGAPTPVSTPAGELADLIAHIETAIVETARQLEVETSPGDTSVSVVAIGEGSNRLTLSVVLPLAIAASSISQAMETGDYSRLPMRAHRALHNISQQMIKKEWAFLFEPFPEQQIAAGSISSGNPVPDPDARRIKGTTVVFGECIRVGGVKPKADLRIANRTDLLHATVTSAIAKTLARQLYEHVAIEGEATWEPDTWEIKEFEATRLVDYRGTQDPLAAFTELAKVAGKRWEGVDAGAYVRGLRSRDEN